MTECCDDHGQPVERAFAWGRLRDSRMDELIGLCRGILADGAIVVEEVRFLRDWLRRNQPTRLTPIGKELFEAVKGAMVRGRMDPDGEGHLLDVMMKLIGGTPDAPDDASMSTTLPLDDPPPEVRFVGNCFCFTGKFRFGTRTECQKAVVANGGKIHVNPRRDTCFLVIGDVGSRDWAHSSLGRKIEKAIELREDGMPVRIISESHWASYLPRRAALQKKRGRKIAKSSKSGMIVFAVSVEDIGLEIDPKEKARPETEGESGLPLKGRTVVVTGTLQRFERREIEELIERLGGKASGSVSKKTSFVVAGESAGSKLEKAKELGVEVLSESEFVERVGMG